MNKQLRLEKLCKIEMLPQMTCGTKRDENPIHFIKIPKEYKYYPMNYKGFCSAPKKKVNRCDYSISGSNGIFCIYNKDLR